MIGVFFKMLYIVELVHVPGVSLWWRICFTRVPKLIQL